MAGSVAILTTVEMSKPAAQYRKNYVREWREYRKLTQAQLAAASGLSDATISSIESGKRGYSDASLTAIARELQTTKAALLRGPPSEENEVLDLLESAPEEKRKLAIQVMKTVLQGD